MLGGGGQTCLVSDFLAALGVLGGFVVSLLMALYIV